MVRHNEEAEESAVVVAKMRKVVKMRRVAKMVRFLKEDEDQAERARKADLKLVKMFHSMSGKKRS